jgi:hypothetical protein
MNDIINHPPHYKSKNGIEVIDVIEGFALDYILGNVVKYVLRAGRKSDSPEDDLRKAQWYLNHAVEKLSPAYDIKKNLAGCFNDGYAAIRERVANGGPGWERKSDCQGERAAISKDWYCRQGCKDARSCPYRQPFGYCIYEYDASKFAEKYRWKGGGDPPCRWTAADGTTVYRTIADSRE